MERTHAQAIAAIFRVSGGRGELASLVSRCGGAGEFIDGWTTFFDDAPIKRIFRQYGINW